jgi:hypothetical protein
MFNHAKFTVAASHGSTMTLKNCIRMEVAYKNMTSGRADAAKLAVSGRQI